LKNKVLYRKRIRLLTLLLQVGLLIAGLTAFWIPEGVSFIVNDIQLGQYINQQEWLAYVNEGVQVTNDAYPFIWYGTDWMVFAHILFAILFTGLLIDPIKNVWLVQFGWIACGLIVPLAAILGYIRGIPIIWQTFDCLFGVIAAAVLLAIHKEIQKLQHLNKYVCP
jgi:hypothetical protein